jgi:hypothetical protein
MSLFFERVLWSLFFKNSGRMQMPIDLKCNLVRSVVYDNLAFIISLTVLLSAAPPVFAITAFITGPMSLMVLAFSSAMTATTAASICSLPSCPGR